MNWSKELDTMGLLCPLPVLRARKHLSMMQSGERMRLLADDPLAQIDVPHFCTPAGHRLISQEKNGDQLIFLIERA